MRRSLRLATGRECVLADPPIPFVRHYHVLYFPERLGAPTESEVDEMLVLAHRLARELGRARLGDPECYSVLLNGARARRKPWFHVHLLPVESVGAKRWALACLSLKRALRTLIPRTIHGRSFAARVHG